MMSLCSKSSISRLISFNLLGSSLGAMRVSFPFESFERQRGFLLFFCKDLFDSFYVFELVEQGIASFILPDHTLFPELLLLCYGKPHEVLFLDRCLFSKLLFDLLCQLASDPCLPGFFIVFKVVSVLPDQKDFLSLLLDLLLPPLLVFSRKHCRHFRSHVLALSLFLGPLLLLHLHQSLGPRLIGQDIFLIALVFNIILP